MQLHKSRLDQFWYFVNERQSVWHRRYIKKLPRPWSSDPILQQERFTNIYRELDPGTQYAISLLDFNAPKPDKVFNILLYRLIGRDETHKAIGFQTLSDFSVKKLENKLKRVRSSGKPVFTAAYMVGAYMKMGSTDKIENVARLFGEIQKGFDKFYSSITHAKSSKEVYEILLTLYGFGNFLAYQVMVDLLYPIKDPILPFSHNDWASAGPGAIKGIKLLFPSASKKDYIFVMRWLQENQVSEFNRCNLDFPFLYGERRLSLANIQNSLCEFHKYVKIQEGTGRGRRKFVPTIRG